MNPLLLGFIITWLMIIAMVAVVQFWLGAWLALSVLIVMVVGCLAWLTREDK